MIRYDPELGLVQMDLGDLEHCGFDHTAFDGELFLIGIEEPDARWPLALIVNFAGGHVVGPATDAAVMQQRRGAQATFELWLTRWRASSPSHCLWCGRVIEQHRPPQPTDTPHVGRNDRAICHSCVKHLAVIVLDQENRLERETRRDAQRATACEYCAQSVPLSGSSPTMHDTGSALAPCTALESEAG
ncbi:MAG: hypothetical protein HY870_08145 [Chloroflexi bacterium]|nr:hypothetical protein [Chloroflexota bacterium]